MKHYFIFQIIILGMLFPSCSNDDSFGISDNNNELMMGDGTRVKANTSFTEDLMNQALSEINWELTDYFIYDKHNRIYKVNMDNNTELYHSLYHYILVKLYNDGSAAYADMLHAGYKYKKEGKTIYVHENLLLSDRPYTHAMTIKAVDFSSDFKRLIIDEKIEKPSFIPENFDKNSTHVRGVWMPSLEDNNHSVIDLSTF